MATWEDWHMTEPEGGHEPWIDDYQVVCPLCGARGEPRKCKIICSNPQCRTLLENCGGD